MTSTELESSLKKGLSRDGLKEGHHANTATPPNNLVAFALGSATYQSRFDQNFEGKHVFDGIHILNIVTSTYLYTSRLFRVLSP